MNLKLNKSYCLNHTKVFLIVLVLGFCLSCNNKQPGLIYILEWTSMEDWQYVYLEMGQEAFIKRDCPFQNCFLTNTRLYFDNVLDFDVLLFNVVHMHIENSNPPPVRSQSQLYILVGLEPALYYPICNKFNNFFNLTWSYKLTSGIIYPYLLVRNHRDEVIGPRKDMYWEYDIEDMAPIDEDIILKLQNKNIAAAVIYSNCHDLSGRQEFTKLLKQELLKYGQQLDVYGSCPLATLSCSKTPGQRNGLITDCAEKIESDYYFYLAFENSFSEDYVSEKVLHGLNHFAVPVVYGGANYTRFMPDGIYLNARTLGVQGLAEEMASIILDQQRYFDFFKWHGYYTYSDTYNLESNDTYTVCNVCAKLNKLIQGSRSTIYTNITNWWNSTDSHNELQTQTMIYYTTPNGTICSPEKAKDTRIIPSILRSITTYFKDILFD